MPVLRCIHSSFAFPPSQDKIVCVPGGRFVVRDAEISITPLGRASVEKFTGEEAIRKKDAAEKEQVEQIKALENEVKQYRAEAKKNANCTNAISLATAFLALLSLILTAISFFR